MADRVSISLRARKSKGEPVQKDEILDALGLEERVAAVTEDPPLSSARLEVAYGDAASSLRKAAHWLMDQRAEAFDKMRAAGLQLDLEIVMHSDEGRGSIVLPPALVVACARRELPISVLAPEA
jgi:hypothetical protein